MSNGGSDGERLSTNQRREAAREKARALRERQKKQDRRGRFILLGSLIVVSIAIVVSVTLTIVGSIPSPRPGPLNMLSDGIVIGENFEPALTPAIQNGDDPVETPVDPNSDAIAIEVYVDYLCPVCALFETTNDERISTLLEQGAATLEIHPVAILDGRSAGTQYSTRAANAAACVANYSPRAFYDFHSLMFERQPAEQEPGLTDDELIEIAEDAEVASAQKIRDCIREQRFAGWVEDATVRATTDPELFNEAGKFATPTVFVNGERYLGAPDDAVAFAQFTAVADATAFSEKSSASPSPSPSPTP